MPLVGRSLAPSPRCVICVIDTENSDSPAHLAEMFQTSELSSKIQSTEYSALLRIPLRNTSVPSDIVFRYSLMPSNIVVVVQTFMGRGRGVVLWVCAQPTTIASTSFSF